MCIMYTRATVKNDHLTTFYQVCTLNVRHDDPTAVEYSALNHGSEVADYYGTSVFFVFFSVFYGVHLTKEAPEVRPAVKRWTLATPQGLQPL